MNFLLRLLAVPCVLLLALPPGWCHAGVVRLERAEGKTATPCGCCRHAPVGHSPTRHAADSESPSSSQTPPARPAVHCCCPHDLLRPEKPVQADDGAALAADVAPMDSAAVPARLRSVEEEPSSARRPLTVLQCVWRC